MIFPRVINMLEAVDLTKSLEMPLVFWLNISAIELRVSKAKVYIN